MTLPPILGTVAIGLAAGVIAKVLLPGKDPGGLITTTLLGIGGSLVAAFVVRHFGLHLPGGPLLAAVLGAIAILVAHRLLIRI